MDLRKSGSQLSFVFLTIFCEISEVAHYCFIIFLYDYMFSLTRYDGKVSEPLVGRQGSRVSMRVARGSASLLPSHGRGIWPRIDWRNGHQLRCCEPHPGGPTCVFGVMGAMVGRRPKEVAWHPPRWMSFLFEQLL